MAAFEYQALDAGGKTRRGVISADSIKSARRELRRQSLTPVSVHPTRMETKTIGGKRRIRSKDLILVTRQLSMLIASGAPVEQALASIGASAETPKTRSVLASVRAGVVEGQSLSDAMRTESSSFPPLLTSIVAAGETAGALDQVLDRVADFQEKSMAMRRKVMSALIYPMVLACVALSVIVALLIFVVPKVVEQFDTMGRELPFLTSMMVNISAFLQHFGGGLLAGIVVAFIVAERLLKLDHVRRRVDRMVLSLPIVGKVARDVASARFSRTFATLASSGAPVLDCLGAARETTPNLVLRDAVDEVHDSVREGGSLSSAMARTNAFPPLMVHMAAGGEASGELGRMFDKGAEYLENEFDSSANIALGLLEPLITIVMGGMVLMIILAIMLPILQLNTAALG